MGTEKTGTSSIQGYLYRNRRRLRSSGYHLLRCGGLYTHHAVAAYCIGDNDQDDFLLRQNVVTPQDREAFRRRLHAAFIEEIAALPAKTHTVIITSEHFHSRLRDTAAIGRLLQLLATSFDEIMILAYLREQSAMCTSWYSTSLKFGNIEALGDFSVDCVPQNYYYNHESILNNWSRVFGDSNMNIARYERASFFNEDLLDDFTARIDQDLLGRLRKYRARDNQSLSPAGQALMLGVNRVFRTAEQGGKFVDMRLACRQRIVKHLSGRGEPLSLAQCQSIYALFEASNNSVAAQYFPNNDRLFPEPVQQKAGTEVPAAKIEAALKDVGKLIRRYCRREGRSRSELQSIIDSLRNEVSRWL